MENVVSGQPVHRAGGHREGTREVLAGGGAVQGGGAWAGGGGGVGGRRPARLPARVLRLLLICRREVRGEIRQLLTSRPPTRSDGGNRRQGGGSGTFSINQPCCSAAAPPQRRRRIAARVGCMVHFCTAGRPGLNPPSLPPLFLPFKSEIHSNLKIQKHRRVVFSRKQNLKLPNQLKEQENKPHYRKEKSRR